MATSPVDVRGMQARQMVERMARQGGSPSPSTSPAAGQQLAEQMSALAGADPQMIQKALDQIKTMMVAIYTKSAFQIPEVARHVASAQKNIDAAIKAAEQASATLQTVNSPIVNNAGMNPQQGNGPAQSGGPAEGLSL